MTCQFDRDEQCFAIARVQSLQSEIMCPECDAFTPRSELTNMTVCAGNVNCVKTSTMELCGEFFEQTQMNKHKEFIDEVWYQ